METTELLKLDLGCGPNKKEGFIGVDILPFDGKVDLVFNLAERAALYTKNNTVFPTPNGFTPWPWENDSVEEVHCSHFLEHLDANERIHFFNELYRVLKPGGKATIVTPHWASGRAYGDLTHKWPPVVEMFWYYLDTNWRTSNAPHVPLNCNFAVTWGYAISSPWDTRSAEVQAFAVNHYREVAMDMIATAIKTVITLQ